MVLAIEMVGLVWWNTSNYIHFTEFHFAKHARTHMEL
jgi:hypothetical protein